MKSIKVKNIKRLKGAPLCCVNIRAGFQNIIENDIERRVSLDKEFETMSPSVFMFHISGDSMVDLGIYEGDIAIVKKTQDIQDGDIVVANVDGAYTIKTCHIKGNIITLEAANPLYKTIKPKFKLEVFGKVTGIVRKIK